MFTLVAERPARLRNRYAEPHRVYQGQAHTDVMLGEVRYHAESVSCPAAMELATWFHDAIYDPAVPNMHAGQDYRAVKPSSGEPARQEPRAWMIITFAREGARGCVIQVSWNRADVACPSRLSAR